MVASLLAHPFRIGPAGTCTTVDQNSDEQYSQLLTVIVGTRQGERDMCLPYGLIEPVWRGLFVEDVQATVDQFGPPVTVDSITVTHINGTEQLAGLSWHRRDDPGSP